MASTTLQDSTQGRLAHDKSQIEPEPFGLRHESKGPVQVMRTIGGVSLVRKQLHLVATGLPGVAEYMAEDGAGDASAPVCVLDYDRLDERGRSAVVGDVRQHRQASRTDCSAMSLGEEQRHIRCRLDALPGRGLLVR